MFNLGFQELLLIGIIALVFIGPKQLPDLAKNVGKFIRDLKRATNEVTDSFQREVAHLNEERESLHKKVKEDLEIKLLPDETAITMGQTNTEKIKKNDGTES